MPTELVHWWVGVTVSIVVAVDTAVVPFAQTVGLVGVIATFTLNFNIRKQQTIVSPVTLNGAICTSIII